MSKMKLQQMLKKNLRLKGAVFEIEKIGTKLAGSIISETFRGKSDRLRQKMIWGALDTELGAASVREVGTLLAYTPEEWNMNLPAEVG
jgi:acid stress-induced BolA-like protein IbaG/YrbA